MPYTFVHVNEFTPNWRQWTPVGNVTSWSQQNQHLVLNFAANRSLRIAFLGPRCFRVRFNPAPNPDYGPELSFAVVERNLGGTTPPVQDRGDHLFLDTGQLQLRIDRQPYRLRVYRGTQLICADEPGYNLVFIPGQEVIANFKTYPANARYCGLGERAGATLFKNETTTTFFNFDNFSYNTGRIPQGTPAGPLNAAEPLYCSVPLLLELNPKPEGEYAGPPYCYGIFLDNTAQSYINIGASDYSDMFGKYYFGALYGEMDYYFMAGDHVPGVLAQYTTLTGRAPMPPKYVFGFHQGGYGYYDRYKVGRVANSYRAARIPIDGLHIDVDFQNNYRTFTHSEIKFPNVEEWVNNLHLMGFKWSTNITPLLTGNALDESGQPAPYAALESMKAANALLFDTRDNGGPNSELFRGIVNYGLNRGSNPYPTFPTEFDQSNGHIKLGSHGRYADLARAAVQQAWGTQYQHLIHDLELDMVWQDMVVPGLDNDALSQPKTFPLDLMMDRGDGVYVPNAVIHNSYALNLVKATWHGIGTLRKQVNHQRNFIIARGGFAGLQRYAGLWTGDSPSTWDYLRILIPQVLNIGLSGIPISGADVGGFAKDPAQQDDRVEFGRVFGGVTNYELLTRWMQLGAFLPWYRNHYNGYTKQFQEVYEYAEPVPTHCRQVVELRYRLIHLFYDAMYEWRQAGLPICRPLFLNDPHDPKAYQYCDDQFFVGHDFLVAPIVRQHVTATPPTPPARQVYLPDGSQWYAFMDNRKKLEAPVTGGTLIPDYYADLDRVPLYVRAGAILPMRELEQFVGQIPDNPLTINIYPGADSSYRLYQDDGITTDAEENQAFRLTEISHTGIPGGQRVRIRRLSDQFSPAAKFFFVAFPGTRRPSSVKADGLELPDLSDPGGDALASEKLNASGVHAYYWNAGIEVTFLKIFDTNPDLTLTVLFA